MNGRRGSSLNPSSPLRNQRGFTLLMVLVMIVVIGLVLGITGASWKTITQRAKEEELLFRGEQYRQAIGSYFNSAQGGAKGAYPANLEDLLRDPRSAQVVRHIRKLYKDPMTGDDFEVIRGRGGVSGTAGSSQTAVGGIIGVRSKSDLEPFKKDGFPDEFSSFVGASKYSDWQFIYEPPKKPAPQTGPPATPGTTPAQPGQSAPSQSGQGGTSATSGG